MPNLYQSLVAVEPITLIVTVLNLFLQMYLLKRFFLNKVLGVLERRRQLADRQIAEAEAAKEDALSVKEAYESNVRKAKEEAGQILENAKRAATQRSEQIIRDARQQAAQIKEKAQGDITREREKALHAAKDEIGNIAVEIAEKVVGTSLDHSMQKKLVEQCIDKLGAEL